MNSHISALKADVPNGLVTHGTTIAHRTIIPYGHDFHRTGRMLDAQLRDFADRLILHGRDPSLLEKVADGLVGPGGFLHCRVWLRGPGDRCTVCELAAECHERTECLHLMAHRGEGDRSSSPCRCPLAVGAHGLAASTASVIVSNSAGPDVRFLDALRPGIRQPGTTALIPLGCESQNLGLLEVSARECFTDECLQALRAFARRVAAVIGNARCLTEMGQQLERLDHENRFLREEILSSKHFEQVLGTSAAIRELRERIDCAARHGGPVLLTGPYGVGKELVARTIHARSPRASGPLLHVQCGDKDPQAIECELFGHEEDAFACAPGRRLGKIELAHGSTLVLDRIDRIAATVQSQLLDVIRTGNVQRLGTSTPRPVSVRVIATTTRPLAEVSAFHPELRSVLDAYRVAVPALKDRREDIPLLVEHYIRRFVRPFGGTVPPIDEADLAGLMRYEWPGNVHELRQVVERAVIASNGGPLVFDGLTRGGSSESGRDPADQRLEAVERAHIVRILRQTGGVIEGPEGAAAILGLNPSTLRSRMAKLGIPRRPAR